MTDIAQAALPMGAVPSNLRRSLQASVFVFGAGLLALVGALLSVYIEGRHTVDPWPPKGIYLDNFSSVMITVTLIMGAVTAEWAARSARSMQRGVIGGLMLSSVFGVAVLNSFGFAIRAFKFGPGGGLYQTDIYALFIVMCVAVAAITLVAFANGVRSTNERVDGAYRERIRATASFWHVVVFAWLIIYSMLYLVK